MCDQQRLGSVCASTYYIKQAWIARSPKKLHSVQIVKNVRMCCCSRTVYPVLDSPAIKGKYDQRMLLSECAVAQTDPSQRRRRFVKPRDASLGGSVGCASDWRPGSRRFNPRQGRQHSFAEIDHEIFSKAILSPPLIQEGQLSVSG